MFVRQKVSIRKAMPRIVVSDCFLAIYYVQVAPPLDLVQIKYSHRIRVTMCVLLYSGRF